MRNSVEREKVKQACVDWLSMGVDAYDIALTLDFKGGIQREQALAAAQQFWQRVDCAVHGSKVKRKGLRVQRVCVLEGDATHNFHFHAAVVLPQQREHHEFKEFLISTWHQFREAGHHGTADCCWDSQGWLNYICKRMTDSTDVLCMATSHIPA